MKCNGGRAFETTAGEAASGSRGITRGQRREAIAKPGVKHLQSMEVETPTR